MQQPHSGDAEEAVAALRRFISRGEYGLREVPQLVKEVITHGYWKQRDVPFSHFEQFVCHEPPDGLGADMDTLERLCGDDDTALALIEKETQRKGGRPPKTDNNVIRFSRKPKGNEAKSALRRLRKDRPDLHARVVAGEVSPHGAMVEAGFRPRTISVPVDVEAFARAIRRLFTPEQIAELVQLLEEPA